MLLDDVLPYLSNVKKRGNQLTAMCPVCKDEKHLYVKEEASQNKVLMYCQKCNAKFKEIVIALNIPPPSKEKLSIIEKYDHVYKKPDGSVAYYKTRTKYSDGSKKFVFYHTDQNGKKHYSKPENSNSLYNLDLLLQANPATKLYIVEGEKCADIMIKHGFLATTTNTGAGGKLNLSRTDTMLLDKFPQKIVVPDNDEAGRRYASHFDNVSILNLADIWVDIMPKQDIYDYLEGNHDPKAIESYEVKAVEVERDQPLNKYELMERDQLISKEIFAEILDTKDDYNRTKAISDCEHRAKELGIYKTFNNNFRAYKISVAKGKQARSGQETNFSGQRLKLNCGEWIADNSGVRKNEINFNNGDVAVKYASPLPVLPTEILLNLDANIEKIKIEFFKDNTWKNIICERVITANVNKIIELANKGLEVNSENAKLLVKYIADCVSLNLDILPRYQAISRLGWVDKEFIPYNQDIKFDGEKEFQSIFKAVSSKGSLKEWIDFICPLRKNIYFRMTMAASFASPLIEKVNALPFIFHLWGGTGSGKTVALMAAMSIWGNPRMGKMVRTMNMTTNSMLSMAAFLCNFPFAGDELQTIKKRGENYDSLIMRVSEGIDRGRMSYTQLNEMKAWKCSFIFTGEEPCTKASSGGGAKNRVIEHECVGKVVENGNAVVSFIDNHYGSAGQEFINSLNIRNINDEYNEIFNSITKAVDTTEKQAMAMSLMLLGDKIAGEVLFNEQPLTVNDIREFLASNADIDISERAYDFTISMIAKNINRFQTMGNFGEIWGKVEENSYIYINKDVLVSELSNAGFEFDAVKRKWAESGCLIKNSQGKLLHQASCNGVKASYIKIKQTTDAFALEPF